MLATGEGAQGPDEQQVLLYGRLALMIGEPLRGLQHGRPGGVARVVADDSAPVRSDGLALRAQRQPAPDELTPPREELHVDVGEGFEAGPELGLRPPHTPGHGPHPPVSTGEQGDDPVGLAEFLCPQDDAVIPEEAHRGPPWTSGRGNRLMGSFSRTPGVSGGGPGG